MKYISLTFIFISFFVASKCAEKPSYFISAEILSCEAKHIRDGGYSVLELKVIEEHQINMYPPFEVEDKLTHSILKKEISIVVSIEDLSCHRAMHQKIDQEKMAFMVNEICCDHGQEICDSANYTGSTVYGMRKNNFKPSESFDQGFNFSTIDVLDCPVHNNNFK